MDLFIAMHINSKNILVVGGAGFIGSHMLLELQNRGYQPIVLDNLRTGHRDAVGEVPFYLGDLGDQSLIKKIINEHDIAAVMHFGAFIEVGESVKNPQKYYDNNVTKTLSLLKIMLQEKVKYLIFSSTAAVYGNPVYTPIDELHSLNPLNPYGKSKRMVEEILQDYAKAYDLKYTILRYFNAAGADPLCRLGERHEPESHLIPLILKTALGERPYMQIFGNDYDTPDGTCIRDYIHVTDLCHAHALALSALQANNENKVYNLGSGKGYSVQEVIQEAERITGVAIPVEIAAKRAGDPAVLVANPELANEVLNWQCDYSDLSTIIQHAYAFLKKQKEKNDECRQESTSTITP